MLTADQINDLIGVKEAYQMPEKLLSLVLDPEKREHLFNSFLELEQDLSFDWFTDYFQTEHGDRDKLKQDYTPDCLCEIISRMAGKAESYLDLCAGCGGLTIKVWRENPSSFFVCEEISGRVLPVLLFNLAIRNMKALVLHGDSLKQEYSGIYQLDPGENFSTIQQIEKVPDIKVGQVISNPPYSLKWEPPKQDSRFDEYGFAPKTKADYAFVLHALSRLRDDGKALFILPHGVLFRGNSEEKIRTELLTRGQIRTIIGLPDKLFLNTAIPVSIFEITKSDAEEDLLVVDASKTFVKGSKQNTMSTDQIDHLMDILCKRQSEDKFASLVTLETIKENGYNLNIPRYVDSFDPPPKIDVCEVLRRITDRELEAASQEKGIADTIKTIRGFSFEEWEAFAAWEEICERRSTSYKKLRRSKGRKQTNVIQETLF